MSISQQFSDFRKTTPRYVQWVLMFAALLVVIVLLILLKGAKKTPKIVVGEDALPPTPELIVRPNTLLDWSNTFVGEERNAQIHISANTRVQVMGITIHVDGDANEASGISATDTCTNEQTIIEPNAACVVNITYRPINAMPNTGVNVAINWNVIDNAMDMATPNAITAIIGARERPQPKPEVVPEPVSYDDSFYYDDSSEFGDDLAAIAPPLNMYEPEPVYSTNNAYSHRNTFGNACSDFAFPAYNTAGIQSGWIKPEGGAYYYHPFSDTNCDTPAGIYNAETGYIMDINNPSHKIGSDSEHIRLSITERVPVLRGGSTRRGVVKARQLTDADMDTLGLSMLATPDSAVSLEGVRANRVVKKNDTKDEVYLGSGESDGVFSSRPYDRTFVLRQYKPIPATIVSDIQADAKLLEGGLPVRATVDRNVYSDNGRTVIIPTGTLMLGYVTGDLPGPYKAVGRMQIKWYQFIRPDGVEFNFTNNDKQPFAADSQGRKGVPGHGNTDYLQQFVMPMLTAVVPAAVNLIAPISDAFVNQIDLDNNTVVQTGTVRSSELAKNEIITAWNNVATKLLVDMMDNTTPPFSIAAGTLITVFSPVYLFVTCVKDIEGDTRNCAFKYYPKDSKAKRADWKFGGTEENRSTEELIGQVRSMLVENMKDKWCTTKDGISWYADTSKRSEMNDEGYSFTTVDFYCRSFGTYSAINNEKQAAVFENQQQQMPVKGSVEYNQQVLGLTYNPDGTIQNPFKSNTTTNTVPTTSTSVVTCDGGANPDANGCCPGETYTDMGDQGFNCCPDIGGDCFPPIQL